MMKKLTRILAVFAVLIVQCRAGAWGKQGHSGVCQVAAFLAAGHGRSAEFLKDRAFDLGYYCNVPDLIWKRPDHYQIEWYNHFMDMEIFEREIKDLKARKPFELTRAEFDAAYPKIPDSAGRAFWRIEELVKHHGKLSAELKKGDLSREQRHALQADWLVTAGAIGHYVGDLAQPLHVTENYDGQLSAQKGLHAWFEDDAVNELHFGAGARAGSSLDGEVMRAAEAKWKKLGAGWRKGSTLDVLGTLASDSNKRLSELLRLDKKTGRGNLKKAAIAFRPMIVERMAAGAVALASLWRRELGWDFDGVKFYTFVAEPEFIAPEKAQPTARPAPSPTAPAPKK